MLDHSGSSEPTPGGEHADPSDRRPWLSWRSHAPGVLVWMPVLAVLGWAAVRWFGLERGPLMVQALAFTPYAALVAPLALLMAVASRRWWAAAMAGLACAVFAITVLPRAAGVPAPPHGPRLRVMSVNLRVGGADPAEVVALVREREVDLLTLQEFTPSAQVGLTVAGLDLLLAHRAVSPRDGYGGSAVYARVPLAQVGVRLNAGGEFTQVGAVVRMPGAAPITVESVHPVPPVDRAATRAWTPVSAGNLWPLWMVHSGSCRGTSMPQWTMWSSAGC